MTPTREEAQRALSEVLIRLKYNRPQHVHVSEVTPRDCEAWFDKLSTVEKYIAHSSPALESPAVRYLAQMARQMAQEGSSQHVTIERADLQLLCDAVLAYTVVA